MSGDIVGEINFYSHKIDDSPLWMDVSSPLGDTKTNYVQIPARVTIHDLRHMDDIFDLDVNGFEVQTYHGDIQNIFDENSDTQRRCYDEMADIVKKRLNASRVVVFNHRYRHRGKPLPVEQCDLVHRNPLFFPHVDNDPSSAYLTMKNVLGEKQAQEAAQKRFQIINVWRPLGSNPITNVPLTICDYASLDLENDVHASEIRGSGITGSLYLISAKTPGAQKWYYMSEMKPNEMFMFKIFDSKSDVAKFGAHTAFINEYVSSSIIEQCSIEMRCLVLYDE